ncbi:MAG: preprotein translocase subunit SecA, partial [Oscillospiraceae bacterium]|nr:preprotein translocase subunit SecA [Oscillospiraceae bacterium]
MFLKNIFGDADSKIIKSTLPLVARIEAIEPDMKSLSDEMLAAKTPLFKHRLARGEPLDSILPEAYALLREANNRITGGKRHYPVQLIGGILLHRGHIVEMQNGEGKTQTALLPLYLRALENKGAHLVTLNSYLAKYHASLAGEVLRSLGMSVGCVTEDTPGYAKRRMYRSDVTYATYTQLGFDYLRDNAASFASGTVLRKLHYAVIDEADSILIDAARSPISLANSINQPHILYKAADQFAKTLKKGRLEKEPEKRIWDQVIKDELKEAGDFVINEKYKTASLTPQGAAAAERYFMAEDIESPDNKYLLRYICNALNANFILGNGADYIVYNGRVVLVNEFTGRLSFGSRHGGGLHQALEAKEGVFINRETKTIGSIAVWNLFGKYASKAGMTGTAKTSATEFKKVYGMETVAVPTNKPVMRLDQVDAVYKTQAAKYRALASEVRYFHQTGQPILIGTVSIEKSERVSGLLKNMGIEHNVLNAKNHEQEAAIIAKAGQKDSVTVITNMAGRGTDILLGEGVAELGGLVVMGTERHESKRID